MKIRRIITMTVLILALITISTTTAAAISCDCGDICVNETGWWRDNGAFTASTRPIQAAVDNAATGETIYVYNGSYYENVIIETSHLTLQGEDADMVTVTNNTADSDVFEVTADYVNISGFNVTGATGTDMAGIYLNSVNYCNISNNIAIGNDLGILLEFSSNNTLKNNTANSNNCDGIYLYNSSNNTLANNTADSNSCGMALEFSNNNKLMNNTANSNGDLGIYLEFSSNNTLTNNIIVSNNVDGIYMYDSSNNTIYNNYFNNTDNAYDDGDNIWNTTPTSGTNIIGGPWLGGNYWSDYAGSDTIGGDGLGDTLIPHNSSDNIQNGGDYHPLVTPGIDTSPANQEVNVEIDTNITAIFSEPMNSSTLNNNTVKVFIQENIAGETFEDTVGTWNSTNFQGFIYTEQLEILPQLIDDSHRTIGEENIRYSTQPLLKDYLIYTNEGIEVKGSGYYSIMGWLGDELVVAVNKTSYCIISKLVFEQNSTDTKTLHVGEIWDLGDGYSLKLLGLDVGGNKALLALNNSSGVINTQVCYNQSACVSEAYLGGYDDSPIFVTYLNKVNLSQSHIELKYTWLISQDAIEIQNNEPLGDFIVKTFNGKIRLENEEDVILSEGDTIPLFDDFKFEVEDTPTVRYRLIRQTDIAVEGDISYNSSSRTVTFDPVSNLNENTDYFPLITTGAEDLAGNGLTEDYIWTFRTIDATTTDTTPPVPTDLFNTTGNDWINYTWSAGSGVVTDGYNVTMNDTWYNTTETFLN